jgi:hypothetical protein
MSSRPTPGNVEKRTFVAPVGHQTPIPLSSRPFICHIADN